MWDSDEKLEPKYEFGDLRDLTSWTGKVLRFLSLCQNLLHGDVIKPWEPPEQVSCICHAGVTGSSWSGMQITPLTQKTRVIPEDLESYLA